MAKRRKTGNLRTRLVGSTSGLQPKAPAKASVRAAPTVSKPPAGYYDPALDAAERAGARGVGDLRSSTDQANVRAQQDYATGYGRLDEDQGTSLAALLRNRTRGLTDLRQSRDRLGQDFKTAVAGRRQSYTNLGESQAEQAQAAGVSGGGALAAALAKRTANEAVDANAQQTAFDRQSHDLDTAQSRMGEDFWTDEAAIKTGTQRAHDDAGTDFQRGVDDRAIGLGIAEREQTFFGQDTAEQRNFQAAQAGYVPPKPLKTAVKTATVRKKRRRATNLRGRLAGSTAMIGR